MKVPLQRVDLLRAGWSVALAGRREETLEETAALAAREPGGGGSLTVRTDVSQPEDVSGLFAATVARFGRVDLLFNNAGTFGPGGVPVEDLPYEAWRHVVDTNLNGAFLCAQAAYRQMTEQDPQGGRIISNGSGSAHRLVANGDSTFAYGSCAALANLAAQGAPLVSVGVIDAMSTS